MKIVILRNTMTSAGNARSGHVIELPDQEARLLIKMNRASEVIDIPVAEEVDRSIGLGSSDIKPIKRGRPRKAKEITEADDAS